MNQPTFEDFDKDLTKLRDTVSESINEVVKKYPNVKLTIDIDHHFIVGGYSIGHIVSVEGEIRR